MCLTVVQQQDQSLFWDVTMRPVRKPDASGNKAAKPVTPVQVCVSTFVSAIPLDNFQPFFVAINGYIWWEVGTLLGAFVATIK